MTTLTPRSIVQELDRYIIGQEEAKRAVAIALCTRERRKRLLPRLRQEITPKNILLIGPTGVGKTEIARRVAVMINAPFIKVEATKFTEVGYVGRDVDSIISELVESSIAKVYGDKVQEVESKAEKIANKKLVDYLCRQLGREKRGRCAKSEATTSKLSQITKVKEPSISHQKTVTKLLTDHQLDDQIVEIEIDDQTEVTNSTIEFPYLKDGYGAKGYFDDLIGNLENREKYHQKRLVSVKEARRILTRTEASKLLDYSEVVEEAIEQAQDSGVIFIDELDKLVGPRIDVGRDISGEGVQRDLLPLLEGSTVITRYGPVRTNHMLFITAGAFYHNRPSDLIPELQGRLPLRVELKPLSQIDLERILTEPNNALTKQYQALLATEGIELAYTHDGISEIAYVAKLMTDRIENIGARRLNTVMEKVLEEINFSAPEKTNKKVVIDSNYVSKHLGNLIQDNDLSRYIL